MKFYNSKPYTSCSNSVIEGEKYTDKKQLRGGKGLLSLTVPGCGP